MNPLLTLEGFGALASIVGVLIGVPGLVFAFRQLRRTKRAAEAAAESAGEALRRLSNVLALSSIEQICGRCRDLLHQVRAKNLTASATAAFELREALAKFSRSRAAQTLLSTEDWSKLLDSAVGVHEVFERAALIRRIDVDQREQMIQIIARIHSDLSMLAGIASERAGGVDADPTRLP